MEMNKISKLVISAVIMQAAFAGAAQAYGGHAVSMEVRDMAVKATPLSGRLAEMSANLAAAQDGAKAEEALNGIYAGGSAGKETLTPVYVNITPAAPGAHPVPAIVFVNGSDAEALGLKPSAAAPVPAPSAPGAAVKPSNNDAQIAAQKAADAAAAKADDEKEAKENAKKVQRFKWGVTIMSVSLLLLLVLL